MRGLKPPAVVAKVIVAEVASFTDAWIETIIDAVVTEYQLVASFTDAWIETEEIVPGLVDTSVASFTDAWIETRSSGRLL